MNKRSVLIIGYGNPFRGDDGLGWHIAQRLATMQEQRGIGSDDVQVQVIPCIQLTPELAEPVSQADEVLFVDASVGKPAGMLVRGEIVASTSPPPGAFTHHLEPATLLAMARLLYARQPAKTTLYQITGVCFDDTEQLSPEVRLLMPVLQNLILAHIAANTTTHCTV